MGLISSINYHWWKGSPPVLLQEQYAKLDSNLTPIFSSLKLLNYCTGVFSCPRASFSRFFLGKFRRRKNVFLPELGRLIVITIIINCTTFSLPVQDYFKYIRKKLFTFSCTRRGEIPLRRDTIIRIHRYLRKSSLASDIFRRFIEISDLLKHRHLYIIYLNYQVSW